MNQHDMSLKMQKAMEKVKAAIQSGGGHTLLATGITGDDARMARAVTDIGVKMLEPNHPALALARGHRGVTSMHNAEKIRHEISVEQMAEVTRGVRNVVPEDVYITVGIPGGFTEIVPVEITDEQFLQMALAGADGLHTHKSSLKDLEALVRQAHRYGLCVDAYIGKATDRHIFGIPADTPEEVQKTAKAMEEIGVDMIGLMSGMSYEALEAGQIHPELRERLEALVEAVKVPTLAEGGINMENFRALKSTGVNILVVGTSFDKVLEKAAQDVALTFMKRD